MWGHWPGNDWEPPAFAAAAALRRAGAGDQNAGVVLAVHVPARSDPGGRAGEKFGEGGTDHPNGYMQTDPSAKLARGALANQNTSKPGDLAAPDDKLSSPLHPGSGITAGANANYPTRAADNLSAITGGAGTGVRAGSAGSSLREQLKARLKEQYGREPSASEVEQAVARAAGPWSAGNAVRAWPGRSCGRSAVTCRARPEFRNTKASAPRSCGSTRSSRLDFQNTESRCASVR